ncbi:hypothetical protein chiPu_0008800 [Chiloscyllium punctatum]|uniref:FAM194 C-terminal domain-containing protein n=1 Tax=Chiloscyllium punctatum TaxID=137246 RepID=A0A401SIX7_CHIPU|nr:hypothetical protein [Chiloscyllium punctatum]
MGERPGHYGNGSQQWASEPSVAVLWIRVGTKSDTKRNKRENSGRGGSRFVLPVEPVPSSACPAMSESSVSQAENSDSQDLEGSAQDADKSVTSSTSSIAESFTQTESTFIDGPSEIIPDIVHSTVAIVDSDQLPLTSVLTQTDSSWLLNQSHRKFEQEYESILEDDVSDVTSKGSLDDIIVHSEFIDDKISGRLFDSGIYSLPSVGPPTILAYKQESKEQPIDYKAIRPKVKNTWLKDLKEINDFKEYWQWSRNKLMQEEHTMTEEQFKRSNKPMVEDSYLSKAPSHLGWNQFRKSVVSVGFDLCQFCGKNLKPLPTPKQLGTEPFETKMNHGLGHSIPAHVEDCLMGRVHWDKQDISGCYPSGNLAVQIFTDKQKKINCIVLEDKADEPEIQAVFSSYGRCTCYHPNGVIWININALGGHYLDNQGTRMRRWYWRDRLSLGFIPFKPIFISLNENIGVRIIEQERIFITFLAMGKQARFKVGTKLKFRKRSNLSLISNLITEDELLLQASQLKVRTAINKLCIALNYPSNDPEKIPLPLYLTSQQQRLSQLQETIRMEEIAKM